MAKEKKQRAEKYDTKLAIEGTFLDVINVAVKGKSVKENIEKKKVAPIIPQKKGE